MKLSCKEATRLMSQAEDRELAAGERAALKLHLGICKACRVALEQMQQVRRALHHLFGPPK
jgi:anti-sigma factor RsiW